MKNIWKGWILSSIGLTIIIFDIAYFFGYKPAFLPAEGAYIPKSWELGAAFLIGLILLLVPATILEKKANQIVDSINVNIITIKKPKPDSEQANDNPPTTV